MVWVLDPQKYADAAVHSRYLVPMAGHSSVIAVVLNQVDLLTSEEARDCVEDLRRLLDTEGLHDTRVLITSAVDGTGLGELRDVLIQTVSARRASTERITADVDAIAARFAPYAGEPDVPVMGGPAVADGEDPAGGTEEDGAESVILPAASQEALEEAFSQAAGVAGGGGGAERAGGG